MAADKVGAPPRAWQRMLSGRRLDLLDPSPLDIEISDIAHGLARVARWNGQTGGDHAFSVAQHSLLVEDIFSFLVPGAPPDARLTALLHDAPEYVIGDMISPFKSAVGGGYKAVEQRLQRAIHLRFGLACRSQRKAATRHQEGRPDRCILRGDAACRLFNCRGGAILRPPARHFRRSLRPSLQAGQDCPGGLPEALRVHREAARRVKLRATAVSRWPEGADAWVPPVAPGRRSR